MCGCGCSALPSALLQCSALPSALPYHLLCSPLFYPLLCSTFSSALPCSALSSSLLCPLLSSPLPSAIYSPPRSLAAPRAPPHQVTTVPGGNRRPARQRLLPLGQREVHGEWPGLQHGTPGRLSLLARTTCCWTGCAPPGVDSEEGRPAVESIATVFSHTCNVHHPNTGREGEVADRQDTPVALVRSPARPVAAQSQTPP